MRAVLVANPNATTTSARTRDVIARALGSELKVDVVETTARRHAADLAAQARADEVDVVVALGGDGTVNEVVEGLLRAGVGGDVPRLAVVPGGSANVFARALSLPREPIEATGAILERLRSGQQRSVGLGRLDLTDAESGGATHWFTFCAGFGLDAEIVREVERRRAAGARARSSLYMRAGLHEFFTATDRRHPTVTISRPGHEPVDRLFLAIVTNTTPWTYAGERPLEPTPEASFDSGLDLFAVRSLRTLTTVRWLWRLWDGGPAPRGRQIVALHDQPRLTLTSSRPLASQVDGDYLGAFTHLDLSCVPRALVVIA